MKQNRQYAVYIAIPGAFEFYNVAELLIWHIHKRVEIYVFICNNEKMLHINLICYYASLAINLAIN